MATIVKRGRPCESGAADFSPVGYYRLGQSYPRGRHRLSYPRLGRARIFTGVAGVAPIEIDMTGATAVVADRANSATVAPRVTVAAVDDRATTAEAVR